jgi:hypothetical protein
MRVHPSAYRATLGPTQVRQAFLSDCTLETFRELERGDVDGMLLSASVRTKTNIKL